MVLAASFEFEKSHNSEIVERPSDNEEVPQVSSLPQFFLNFWMVLKFAVFNLKFQQRNFTTNT